MSGGAGREYRIGFVLEQTLGHITHAKNLQVNVPRDPSVRPFWHLIPFQVRRPATKIPLYNRNWTVRAGWRARRALAATRRTTAFDALFFHTHVPAILSTDWLRRVPSVISMDATPIQYAWVRRILQSSAGFRTGAKHQAARASRMFCFGAANRDVGGMDEKGAGGGL